MTSENFIDPDDTEQNDVSTTKRGRSKIRRKERKNRERTITEFQRRKSN